ncbi:MAG TPA: RIP metalloprotease RseP [Acidobacteriota bacterium]|nr:RIP metalloprotease RseP [Acidobacteriota bacterium]
MELLNDWAFTAAAFIFVLGVLIFIHELGHHLMAKALGIRVEAFSLGFGPRLFGFRMGETDYRVSLLPLGGYVKMAGENVVDELTGAPYEFLSKPRWQRFLVAIAGPAMNIGLAVVLMTGLYLVGINVPEYLSQPAQIGFVAPDSAAEQAGLQKGDVILSVDGVQTPTWERANLQVITNGGKLVPIRYRRDGQVNEELVEIQAVGPSEQGTLGIAPHLDFKVSEVSPGSPADEAGLQSGDEIVQARVGGVTADNFSAIQYMISNQEAGTPIDFTVQRDGQSLEMTIAPYADPEEPRRVVIGAKPVVPTELRQYSLAGSAQEAVRRNVEVAGLLFKILGQIVTGDTSLRTLSGPLEIANFSSMAAREGPSTLINFMAFISLQLGILNLLPIPILDGGVILLLAIEGLRGRDLSVEVKERILQAGFLFLVLLMGFVIINDITKQL